MYIPGGAGFLPSTVLLMVKRNSCHTEKCVPKSMTSGTETSDFNSPDVFHEQESKSYFNSLEKTSLNSGKSSDIASTNYFRWLSFITDHPKFCKTPQFLFKTLAIPSLWHKFLWFPINFPNKNPEVSPVTHSTLETRGQNPSTLLAAAAHLATDEAATAPRLHGLNGCWTKNRGTCTPKWMVKIMV